MLFNKKEEFICKITGLDPKADNAEFIVGKITGVIMGITNFHRNEKFVISQYPDGTFEIIFNATPREAKKIGAVLDESLPWHKGIKVYITNDVEKV